jgi:molybdate transport system ATP-binding protein
MQLIDVSVTIQNQTVLDRINWHVPAGQSWVVLGTNASGKSTLARLLTGDLVCTQGRIDDPIQATWVSLESQQELYERELYRDDTDFMEQLDDGTTVSALLMEIASWSDQHDQLVTVLHLTSLLQRGYRLLSAGEGRRVMLARALLAKPALLILDEPFEGLDPASRLDLHRILGELIEQGQQLILLINQLSDLVVGFPYLALLDKGTLLFSGAMPADMEQTWQQLLAIDRPMLELPPRQSTYQLANWPDHQPLVDLVDGFVQYDETYQFRAFNWQLRRGRHTQVRGPNGCGKSTLLGLITGDHPQCYRNQMQVLGYQRGQGESIWQIKKHLGYVSGNLHRDYRVSGNVLTVVLSGLTDSIGVYQSVGDTETALAKSWLALIGLADKAQRPFKALSMGEQRLVLIARALIKQPPLLILDEPTQGLDDFNRFYVLDVVARILAQGPTTLLFVSHRQDETLACIEQSLVFTPDPSGQALFSISQD